MLGTKIYKKDEFPYGEYNAASIWANANNAIINDMGDYYEVAPMPSPSDESLAVQARRIRDKKLVDTDYLLMPDYPITPEGLTKVKAYRQSLREIPEQQGFPRTIVWPVLEM